MGDALELSGREFEIVRGLFSGKKEAAIALELEISVHTVHTHVKRLYRKLGVSDRSELLIRLFASCIATRNAGFRNERSRNRQQLKITRLATVPNIGDT